METLYGIINKDATVKLFISKDAKNDNYRIIDADMEMAPYCGWKTLESLIKHYSHADGEWEVVKFYDKNKLFKWLCDTDKAAAEPEENYENESKECPKFESLSIDEKLSEIYRFMTEAEYNYQESRWS